jgi:hypothetical protein
VNGKEHLEGIHVGGWIILKLILKNRIEGINLAGGNNSGMSCKR